MPVTRTRTSTKTFTRVALIKLQVDRVLTRSRIDSATINSVLRGIDNKWIKDVILYAFDSKQECWAELYITIDWKRNQLHVSAGRCDVTIDSRWRNDLAVEVEKTIALFEDYCAGKNYEITCHTRYADNVDRDYANSVLNFVKAEPVHWAGEPVGTSMTIPEIDEFSIGINIIDRD